MNFNFDGPWRLCSNEMDREFHIIDVNGQFLVKVLTVRRIQTPWLNKRQPAASIWRKLTTQPERNKIALMVAAPELFQQLQKAHRFLRKSGYDMTEIDALLNKLSGDLA